MSASLATSKLSFSVGLSQSRVWRIPTHRQGHGPARTPRCQTPRELLPALRAQRHATTHGLIILTAPGMMQSPPDSPPDAVQYLAVGIFLAFDELVLVTEKLTFLDT